MLERFRARHESRSRNAFHQHADLSAGVDVVAHQALVLRAGLSLPRRLALLRRTLMAFLDVSARSQRSGSH